MSHCHRRDSLWTRRTMTTDGGDGASPATITVKKPKDMTKAERRALQEKQRAEKEAKRVAAAASLTPTVSSSKPKQSSAQTGRKRTESFVSTTPSHTTGGEGKGIAVVGMRHGRSSSISGPDRLEPTSLFHHLELARGATKLATKDIHPAILKLGLLYRELVIVGSNARCIAVIRALSRVIQDYHAPPTASISRHLLGHLSPQISYLVAMRPMSVSMGNAIRYLKYEISHHLPPEWTEEKCKEYVVGRLDDFIRERIERADEEIMDAFLDRFVPIHAPKQQEQQETQEEEDEEEEVMLVTFGKSSLVQKTILKAKQDGRRIRVCCVDARPMHEGRPMLDALRQAGVDCLYTPLHGLERVFRENKVCVVTMGAHAILGNGAVLARVGTACVASLARSHHVPVTILCETYKFTERVQLDAFVWNEIGKSDALVQRHPHDRGVLQGHDEMERLKVLNVLYDVTPADLVNVLVTDVGLMPCSSVPVILREYRPMLQ